MTKPHDTLRETRIDNRVDRRHSNSSSSRYHKVIHQDSFDEIPDFNSNNQDVRNLKILKLPQIIFNPSPVYSCLVTGTTIRHK